MAGKGNRFGFVLDDKYGVALIAQAKQELVHPLDIVRMKPNRWFVEPGHPLREVTDVQGSGIRDVDARNRGGPCTLGKRFAVVVQLSEIDAVDGSAALARRAHAAGDAELAALLLRGARFFGGHGAGAGNGCDSEGEGLRRANVGLAEPAEDNAQHGVGVGRGSDRRTGV